jgi:peptidoglycan/xylan/chitin deacetylase (PgdA/CDA1 family)
MLSRRNFIKLGGAALLSTAFSNFNLPKANLALPPIVYHGSRQHRFIALTFDDCYWTDVIEHLMELVTPYPDFHFTFFAIGDVLQINEAKDPGIWRRLVVSGHEIGYHTMHHIDTNLMSTQAMLADFDQWNNLLRQVVGFSPEVRFAKSPYNDVSLSFEALCVERGLVDTRFSLGYEADTVDHGMTNVAKTQNGDIVQLHTYQQTNGPVIRQDLAITTKAVPYLAQQGFKLVTMSKLYDDLLVEQNSSDGCDVGTGQSLTRSCVE